MRYACPMMRLATIDDFVQHSHQLALYCLECDRWKLADLAALIRSGRGALQVCDARFRCRDCGAAAEKQVRPPVPRLGPTLYSRVEP